MKTYLVGILIFDDIELLDFCGPFEVFSVTRVNDNPVFKVVTVAEKGTITTRGGLNVNSHYTLDNAPKLDILLIPGGQGTRREMYNESLIEWIRLKTEQVELVLSVCSGSLLLAKARLLDGQKATTHHLALDLLREVAPKTEILPSERFIDNGRIIVSAGIDVSLYVVGRLFGQSVADVTAEHMEYRR